MTPVSESPGGPAAPFARVALAPPARPAELAGRLVIALGLAALLYALWTPRLEGAAAWTAKELRILPRMSVFVLAALGALMVQGARPRPRILLAGGLLLGAIAVWLLPREVLWAAPLAGQHAGTAASTGPAMAEAAGNAAGRALLPVAGPVLELLRFQASLLAAILLGTWLGRSIPSPAQLIAVLFCAVAGDVWLNAFCVPEAFDAAHPLRLLRLPWPPPRGRVALSPAFTDVVFLSATVEAARNLGVPLLSVVLGAVSGYCAGSFLGLDPWPAWPALSMALFTSGVLVGCWPDLRCSLRDTGKALLLAALLLAALLGVASLQRALSPAPEPRETPARYRHVT